MVGDLVGVELRGLVLDALGVAAGEVVQVVVHARHHDGDVARGGEIAEHLGGAAVAGRVEEQEVAVRVVELAQLAQARVVVADAVGPQPRDLAVDRLGVGRVAERDRRAVEVADQLRALVGERVGDVRVQTLEEGRHGGRIGVARDQPLEVAVRRAAAPADRRSWRAPPPEHWPAIWQTARAASSAIRRAGPVSDERAHDHRDEQQHADVLRGDLSALPSQHGSRVPRAALPRQRREAQPSGWARAPKLKPEAVQADENPNGTAR